MIAIEQGRAEKAWSSLPPKQSTSGAVIAIHRFNLYLTFAPSHHPLKIGNVAILSDKNLQPSKSGDVGVLNEGLRCLLFRHKHFPGVCNQTLLHAASSSSVKKSPKRTRT